MELTHETCIFRIVHLLAPKQSQSRRPQCILKAEQKHHEFQKKKIGGETLEKLVRLFNL